MSTANGGLSMVVQSHGPVPSVGTWQRGSILKASCRDVFRACIARWWAPAIADPRACCQGSVWFSKGSRSLRTVSPSLQSSVLCRTGDAGGGGVAGAWYLNGASSWVCPLDCWGLRRAIEGCIWGRQLPIPDNRRGGDLVGSAAGRTWLHHHLLQGRRLGRG